MPVPIPVIVALAAFGVAIMILTHHITVLYKVKASQSDITALKALFKLMGEKFVDSASNFKSRVLTEIREHSQQVEKLHKKMSPAESDSGTISLLTPDSKIDAELMFDGPRATNGRIYKLFRCDTGDAIGTVWEEDIPEDSVGTYIDAINNAVDRGELPPDDRIDERPDLNRIALILVEAEVLQRPQDVSRPQRAAVYGKLMQSIHGQLTKQFPTSSLMIMSAPQELIARLMNDGDSDLHVPQRPDRREYHFSAPTFKTGWHLARVGVMLVASMRDKFDAFTVDPSEFSNDS
jgi:hypothetical protein